MVVLIFSYKVRADADQEALAQVSRRMWELVQSKPEFGFRGGRYLSDSDGTLVAVYEFESLDGLERFRREPEHLAVQRRGAEFFDWVRTDVCTVERQGSIRYMPL